MTHAGYFADRALAAESHEQMSAQSIFNPASFSFCRKMTDVDQYKVIENFTQAAEVAVAAGFDCVEIHCGHGYLLSQYLSPALNPSTTVKERVSFPLKVL